MTLWITVWMTLCSYSPGAVCPAEAAVAAGHDGSMDVGEPLARAGAPAAEAPAERASRLLHAAALARALDDPGYRRRLAVLVRGQWAFERAAVNSAIDAAIADAAADLLGRGWRPHEVYRFAARRLDPTGLAYVVDALATSVLGGASLLTELRALDARVWWTSARPHVEQWAERHRRGRADTLRTAVDVLALLAYLPRTDVPSSPTRALPTTTVDDEAAASRIDALLARAGATDSPAEASACAAKAEELLLRHAGAEPVRRRVLADPRRLVAVVGTEVAGLVQRAAALFGRRRAVAALPAGSATERA
jgi:hypothetical protein